MTEFDTTTIDEIRERDSRTVGDYLEIVSDEFQCAKCQHTFGPVDENPKAGLAMREREIEDLGDLWIEPETLLDEDLVVREFLCPNCATRITIESCRRDDPVVDEIRLDPNTL